MRSIICVALVGFLCLLRLFSVITKAFVRTVVEPRRAGLFFSLLSLFPRGRKDSTCGRVRVNSFFFFFTEGARADMLKRLASNPCQRMELTNPSCKISLCYPSRWPLILNTLRAAHRCARLTPFYFLNDSITALAFQREVLHNTRVNIFFFFFTFKYVESAPAAGKLRCVSETRAFQLDTRNVYIRRTNHAQCPLTVASLL